MNKSELIKVVAAENAMTQTLASTLIESVLRHIGSALAEGYEVDLHGFGKFSVTYREARTGRNPATGEAVQIAASHKVSFKAAKALKDSVN